MDQEEDNDSRINKISKILNYIGCTLIFFGICYLLFNNWNFLADLTRVFLSLGVACWALYIGVSLTTQGKNATSSGGLFMLGGLLLPLGISVSLNTLHLHFNLDTERMIVTGLSFIVFLLLQLHYKREVLLLFCVLFGTSFFIAGTHFLNYNAGWFATDKLISYQALALGLSYLLLGFYISFSNNGLTGWLSFFGDLLVLVASFYLGGLFYENSVNVMWEIAVPLILLLSFLLYVPFKSKILLYLNVLFLMIYISRMTYNFAIIFGSLGWPVMLIVVGIFLMIIAFILANMMTKK